MKFAEWSFLRVLRDYSLETGNLMSYAVARDKTGLCLRTLQSYFAACQRHIRVLEPQSGRRPAKVIVADIQLEDMKSA